MILLACPQGKINKSAPRPDDGAPVIRLLSSGTNVDLTGDKVSDELLNSMLEQAKAGTVQLKENHNSTFPMGWSFDAEIVKGADGRSQLFIDFWLDRKNKDVDTLLSNLDRGTFKPQCSIGLLGDNIREEMNDPHDGKVGLLKPAKFDHVAFTPPDGAAYPLAGVESVVAKSLLQAAQILKGGNAGDTKMPTTKDEMMAKLKDLDASREARSKDMGAGDMMAGCKAAGAHAQGLVDMAKDVLENKEMAPEDMRAYIQHLMQENAVIAQALNDLGESGGDTSADEPQEPVTPTAGAEPEKNRNEQGAAAGPATEQTPAPPIPATDAGAKKDSPPSTDVETPDRSGAEPSPGDGVEPSSTGPSPEGEPDGEKEEMAKTLKSMKAALDKSNARLAKLEGTINKSNSPFAMPSRAQDDTMGVSIDEAVSGMSKAGRQSASGQGMTDGFKRLGSMFGLDNKSIED